MVKEFLKRLVPHKGTGNVLVSRSHTGLTTMLRPSCDLKMLEFWEDRRLIARLVADGRASKISRRKRFKTSDWWYDHVRPVCDL